MRTIIISIFLLMSFSGFAQIYHEDLYSKMELDSMSSNSLFIKGEALGFFKNDEYFAPIRKGATYPGVLLRPTIAYQFEKRILAEFGFTSLYYSGDQYRDGTYLFNGLYAKLLYQITDEFKFTLGNYDGGINHRLIEPIYKWDSQFLDKPESGIQMVFKNKKYFADIWLNWQRYIEKGDDVPEVLTFGFSGSMKLTKPEKQLSFSVPLQLIIYHEGGQINESDDKMIVSGNLVTGISANYRCDRDRIKSLGFNAYFVGYYDKLSDLSKRPYTKGWGLYTTFDIDIKPMTFMVGYWNASKFYSFDGEPLFASFNTDYPDQKIKNRSLFTTKSLFTKKLDKCFSLGAQFETYTDLKAHRTDYSFGVHMRFLIDWKVK